MDKFSHVPLRFITDINGILSWEHFLIVWRPSSVGDINKSAWENTLDDNLWAKIIRLFLSIREYVCRRYFIKCFCNSIEGKNKILCVLIFWDKIVIIYYVNIYVRAYI